MDDATTVGLSVHIITRCTTLSTKQLINESTIEERKKADLVTGMAATHPGGWKENRPTGSTEFWGLRRFDGLFGVTNTNSVKNAFGEHRQDLPTPEGVENAPQRVRQAPGPRARCRKRWPPWSPSRDRGKTRGRRAARSPAEVQKGWNR